MYEGPNPTAIAVLDYGDGTQSFCAFDESGEVMEALVQPPEKTPDWTDAGVADPRGMGGADGYEALRTALEGLEENARLGGIEPIRLTLRETESAT